ncbi:hypothetical protein ACFU7T_10875 [Streptomyces sp. NPDC057555]|uniref:hypothetical protein n=1 Tax=Streptomyces sp. NPDC057555 TaxID=3346166 RepID=UPI003677A291
MAGADRAHHCLSRRGDRWLNAALRSAALTQIRMPGTWDTPPTRPSSRKERRPAKHDAVSNAVWAAMSGAPWPLTSGVDGEQWAREENRGRHGIQHGRCNPDGQLFEQAASRLHHDRACRTRQALVRHRGRPGAPTSPSLLADGACVSASWALLRRRFLAASGACDVALTKGWQPAVPCSSAAVRPVIAAAVRR